MQGILQDCNNEKELQKTWSRPHTVPFSFSSPLSFPFSQTAAHHPNPLHPLSPGWPLSCLSSVPVSPSVLAQPLWLFLPFDHPSPTHHPATAPLALFKLPRPLTATLQACSVAEQAQRDGPVGCARATHCSSPSPRSVDGGSPTTRDLWRSHTLMSYSFSLIALSAKKKSPEVSWLCGQLKEHNTLHLASCRQDYGSLPPSDGLGVSLGELAPWGASGSLRAAFKKTGNFSV